MINTIIPTYIPSQWFWVVAGNTSQAWSSQSLTYVDAAAVPPDRVTRIASESDLCNVLDRHGLFGPDIARCRALAKRRLNDAAGATRLKYITDAPGQDLTYDRKRREALQAIDDPTPTAQKYPVLAASIGIEVPTTGNAKTDFDAVCALVISRETAWAAAASQIEAVRLAGIKQIDAAATVAEVAETVSATETALKAL